MTWQHPIADDVSADELEEGRRLVAQTSVLVPHEDGILSGKEWTSGDVREMAGRGVRRPLATRIAGDDGAYVIDPDTGLLVPSAIPSVRYSDENGATKGWSTLAPSLNPVDLAQTSSRVTVSRKRVRSFVATRRRSYWHTVGASVTALCECESWDVRSGTCECWRVGTIPVQRVDVEVPGDDGAVAIVPRWFYGPVTAHTSSVRLSALASHYVASDTAQTYGADNGRDVAPLAHPVDYPQNVVMSPAIETDRAAVADVTTAPFSVTCECATRWGRTAPSPVCVWCKGTGWRPYLIATSDSRLIECSAVRMTLGGIDSERRGTNGAVWTHAGDTSLGDVWPLTRRAPVVRPSVAIKSITDVLSDVRWTDTRGRNRHTVIHGIMRDGVQHQLNRGWDRRGRPGWWIGTARFVRDDVLDRWHAWRRPSAVKSRRRAQTTRADRAAVTARTDAINMRADVWADALGTIPTGESVTLYGIGTDNGTDVVLSRPLATRYVVTINGRDYGAVTPAMASIKARRAVKRTVTP